MFELALFMHSPLQRKYAAEAVHGAAGEGESSLLITTAFDIQVLQRSQPQAGTMQR